jgi:hypothetical protein
MQKREKTGGADALWVERLAEARGLGLAHTLFPDTITAALARASASLSSLPADLPPTTDPAHTFDPAGDSVGASFVATNLGGRI